jgi:hypothetical protein
MAELVIERFHGLDGFAPAPGYRIADVGAMPIKAGTRTQYDDCL